MHLVGVIPLSICFSISNDNALLILIKAFRSIQNVSKLLQVVMKREKVYNCSFPQFFRHARRYFINLVDDQLYEVQRVMGLLAYPANTTLAPYRVSSS